MAINRGKMRNERLKKEEAADIVRQRRDSCEASGYSGSCSAAADEVHDFEAIVSGHNRRSPFGARKKFQISLNGQAVGREP